MMKPSMALAAAAVLLSLALSAPAKAQQNSVEEATRRAAALQALPADAARRLFFLVDAPADRPPQAIGAYGKGCVAGAQMLEPDGHGWQAMRLSRHRNFGHPKLVAAIKSLAASAQKDNWPGLLVGDMGQPRGGPMLTGHASHQMGLEADIWLTPAPADRRLSNEEREEMSAIDMVQPDLLDVHKDRFTQAQALLLRRAALLPGLDRIFVNAAIKQSLCRTAGNDRGWLRKIRPWEGHTYHFHMALTCSDASCKNRNPIPPGDGCGKDLAYWFRHDIRFPKAPPNAPPPHILTLSEMPADCADVLSAPPR